MSMDVVDYKIFGDDMQFVEVELDPGEAAVGEAGSMFYMADGVTMDTIFGDGSPQQRTFLDKLFGAGKRLLVGESLFTTVFYNQAPGKRVVAFGAAYPGKILPIPLAEVGGTLLCQKDSFLCGAKGVSIGVHFQRRLGAGFFGGEGFILQRLEGDGLVFVHAGGAVIEKQLAPGETLRLDTGCLVALEPTVDFDVEMVGNVRSALFGGEGLFLARVRGPGRVWLQSLPLARLANRIVGASKVGGSHGGEQGSLFGQFARIFEQE